MQSRTLLPVVLLATLASVTCDQDPASSDDRVASVEVMDPTAPLQVGDTLRLTAVARTRNGAPLSGRVFTWTSAAAQVATVDQQGLVTGMAAGRAWISAVTGGRSDSTEVVIEAPHPEAPQIDSVSPNQIQAGWAQFTIAVHGDGFSGESRIWWNETFLETSFVDVTRLEGTVPPSLVASPGTASLTVAGESAGSPRSNPVPFVIHPRPALSLRIHLAGNAVFVGHRLTLHATPLDQFGDPIEDRPVEWSSSDTTVARVVGDQLQGLRDGVVELEARATPASSRVTVRVLTAPELDLLVEAAPFGIPELFVYRLGAEPGLSRIMAPGTYGWHASPSPDGSQVAFVAPSGAGDLDIWVVQRGGTGLRQLTADPAIDDQPAWSPDGATIAFISNRAGKPDLWIMDADGGEPRNLTHVDAWVPEEESSWPAWSPDGSKLAFGRSFGTGRFLQIVDADGSGLRQLRAVAGSDLLEPAWSPDGLTIAARRRVAGSSGTDTIELISAQTGDAIPALANWPAGPRAPNWLPGGWMAVVGLSETNGRAVHLVQVGSGVQVVPVPVELTSHNRAVLLPR